jgi:hypothetical protein
MADNTDETCPYCDSTYDELQEHNCQFIKNYTHINEVTLVKGICRIEK